MASVLRAHEADQLDARHLGAVTLAVAGLENPGVAAVSRRELRPDFLEQPVCRFTLLYVTTCESARVQRARLRLRDQLLDKGAKLLGLGLGRLDRAVLDERGRQVAHERELLLARSAKRTASLAVAHELLLHVVG